MKAFTIPVTTQASNNMTLSLDASVLRLTHEGVTNFACLSDFDKKSIENLPRVHKNSIPDTESDATNRISAEVSFAGVNVSLISTSRLITSFNADNHYSSIARVTTPQNIGYASVLETFKIEHEACVSVKDDYDSKVPNANDKENYRKIILWSPVLKYFLSNYYGSHGPYICVIREDSTVPDEIMDLLLAN